MSEEQLRDQTQDRWRETLALLGLPAESEKQPEPTVPEPPSEPHLETREPESSSTPEVDAVSFSEQGPETDVAPSMEEPVSESTWQPEPVTEDQLEEAPEQREEPRGRRRGRRGGRGRTHGSPDEERRSRHGPRAESRGFDEERPPESPSAEEAPEPELDAVDEEEELEPVAEETAVDTTDEEPDTLSDWNVPSWQELISSLYRPDQ
jgi:hypothetical protein